VVSRKLEEWGLKNRIRRRKIDEKKKSERGGEGERYVHRAIIRGRESDKREIEMRTEFFLRDGAYRGMPPHRQASPR
jgi:hypothetical protein